MKTWQHKQALRIAEGLFGFYGNREKTWVFVVLFFAAVFLNILHYIQADQLPGRPLGVVELIGDAAAWHEIRIVEQHGLGILRNQRKLITAVHERGPDGR